MRLSKKSLAVATSMALVVSTLTFQPAEAAKKPKLSKTKATLKVGQTLKLTVKNAKKKAKVSWKTSKKSVAKITKKTTKGKAYAKIKAVKKGSAKITASYKAGKTKKKLYCKITVKKKTTKATPTPTQNTSGGSNVQSTSTPTPAPTNRPADPTATPTATPVPTPTVKPTFAPATQDYEFFNEYTLGYKSNRIVAYKDGKSQKLEDAGVPIYNQKTDNIFAQHIENNNWYDDKITLTQPISYTTNDGVVHEVGSMLTNFNFWADPAAIDNSENDGKLYVYGTTEGIDYSKGKLAKNGYNNHSLTICSTEDMVNWTDEGTLDNLNLTNKPSSVPTKEKVKCKWGSKAWAPSGLKIDGDGDGDDEYYIFYTNGGAVGYVQGESPKGPWQDDLGKVLFTQSTPNCAGVVWCFDPAVLVDDKGDAYVYFGGGTNDDKAHGKTGRVCKIKFEEGTGKVLLDGDPQELDNYYMFEDSEINQFNGKYYYSYCTNFNVPAGDKWIGSGHIAAYVSSDPMNIAFAPEGSNGDKYTDENGVYHHYLGTILENPSTIYGESYNNHHHMQSFKGKNYIFYHSTVLSNVLFRDNKQYRNLHVDEISVDAETDEISITPTYEGAKQIEDFNPYKNTKDGSTKYINATTSASSAGVKATRDDVMVEHSINGSPMVLDEIDTGDWTCIKGVNFGSEGLKKFSVELMQANDAGRIELFIDSPTKLANKIASIDIMEPTDGYVIKSADITKEVKGKHDVYFVFRGSGYKVATWIFSDSAEATGPDISDRPEQATPTPVPTKNPNLTTGWNEAKTEYTVALTEDVVTGEGGALVEVDENQGSVTLNYNGQYPGVWFTVPEAAVGKFSKIEFTYKDVSDGDFGTATRYTGDSADQDINWNGKFAQDGTTETIELDSTKDFEKFKIFRNNAEDVYVTITSMKLVK